MNKITVKEGDILEIRDGMIYLNFIYVGNISSIGTIITLFGE